MHSSILIYYPSNKSSNVIETIARELRKSAAEVFLLTHAPRGELHARLERFGISTHAFCISRTPSLLFYLRHFFFLIAFARKHKISTIQSHLQQANIVAVFAQFFIRARTIIYRHHFQDSNRVSQFFDLAIDLLARTIVVPSDIIHAMLLNSKRIAPSKVLLIPYAYDFSDYPRPSPEVAREIRDRNKCELLLIVCGRFVPLKRNELAFFALAALLRDHCDVKLLALDEGPNLNDMKRYVRSNGLDGKVEFAGYRPNVMDYIAAADVLIHPSYCEASNNAVKEAGLLAKTVVACSHVGDFSDYIQHGINGYLINRDTPLQELISTLKLIYSNKDRHLVGQALRDTIYRRFHLPKHTLQRHTELAIPSNSVTRY